MDSGSSSLVLFLHETTDHVGLSKIYAPYVNQVLSLPHGPIHFAGSLMRIKSLPIRGQTSTNFDVAKYGATVVESTTTNDG